MEVHVRNAISISSNQDWDLLLAQIVQQILFLQMEVHVSATLGSQEQMEAHVHNAMSISSNQDWELLIAPIVQQTLFL